MPSRPLSGNRHRRHDLILAVAAASSAVLLFVLLLLLFLYLYLSLHRRSPTLPISSSPSSAADPLRRFPHRLLRYATASFDPSRSLGRGASASVFRGILPDGKSVAVKRLDPVPLSSSSSSALLSNDREFQNELRVLAALPPSPFIVSLLGYCVEGRRRRLLVYEYMCNGSLQETLFGPSAAADLTWDRRFSIILDVARALAFLHLECDPPVIHGDIKPSNVLLGADFQAKVSDFGLSRIKSEAADAAAADLDPVLFSQELPPSQELGSANSQVDFAFSHHACSSKSSKINDRCITAADTGVIGGANSPKGKEVASMTPSPCEDELFVGDNCRELTGYSSPPEDGRTESNRQLGREWWWQQDGSGELCSKDYVREWIGSQICPPRNPDWDEEGKSSRIDKSEAGDDTLFVESCTSANDKKKSEKKQGKGTGCSNNKQREMREWWKEEYFAEINNKGAKRNKGLKRFRAQSSHEEGNSSSNKNATRRGIDSNLDISFRMGWKKKRSQSMGSDVWNGDMFSKELSSTTTSMRGTVCYIAPECGHSMEKADIYSFGVLILVIISGRRPLHVLASPMQLERANLISWCRQLVQGGNVLDLVDEKLKDSYDKEQATLCINLALSCLQRMPELRPDSGDIVKILKGEMDLPVVPFEFSPSPPLKANRKSRRKATLVAE